MRRFFFNPSLAFSSSIDQHTNQQLSQLSQFTVGSSITLTEEIYHHWCRVLRAKVGDQSLIFDGLGGQSVVELQAIDKKSAQARIVEQEDIDNSSSYHSTIAIVMSRGDRMDYAIQKSTELGVTAIQLLTSQHGEVRLKANQVDKKMNHWQQVAISACEQCGLNRPPLILSPLSIEQWLQLNDQWLQLHNKTACDEHNLTAHSDFSTNLDLYASQVHSDVVYLVKDSYYQSYFNQPPLPLVLAVPSQQERQNLDVYSSIIQNFKSAADNKTKPRFDILIGAEGGLSEAEYQLSRKVDFLPWQLGNRVLRTETAPVVALSTLMFISENQ